MEVISDSGEIRKEILDVIIKKTKCNTKLDIHGAIFISTSKKTNVIHLSERVIYNQGKALTCHKNIEDTLDNYAYVSMNPYDDGFYCQPRALSYQRTKFAMVSKGLQNRSEEEQIDGYVVNVDKSSSDEESFEDDTKEESDIKLLSPSPIQNLATSLRRRVQRTTWRPQGRSAWRRHGITFECENCLLTFTRSTSLLKHKERCKDKKNDVEKFSEDKPVSFESPTSTTSKWTTPPGITP